MPLPALRRLAGAALALVCLAVAAAPPARAVEQSTPAGTAILVDLSSGAVLLEKNADRPVPPASMSKLMTLYVVFEALETGRIASDDVDEISPTAAAIGGSSMFLRPGERVSVENLVKGVAVQSGNDASVALAEALAGTEAAFAEYMTTRGREMGLENSVFVNATGWPHPDHRMTARDLATVAARLVRDFPERYRVFAREEFAFDGRVPANRFNRNPLLGLGIGADGLKTGHTEAAGYGLVASAERDGRRVVLVVTGLESTAQRRRESERLINWAFRAFETRRIYRAGEPVLEADVWIGAEPTVALAPERDVVLTVPLVGFGETGMTARYDAPVAAPVARGDRLGELTLSVTDMPDVTVPLVAATDVAAGGFGARFSAAASLLLDRVLPDGGG